MLSMLGDAHGDAPGGFLVLSDRFEVAGRWDPVHSGMAFNCDFWYQPRHNVMVSSEWGAPNTIKDGFKLEDVKAGRYGRNLNFWDWSERRLIKSIDLGEKGMIPLEVRFHHDPKSVHGFVGAALSSTIWHWFREGQSWSAKKIIEVAPIEAKGWPYPVPGLITDLVLSLDDRWLYFSDWLHGDIRRYDVRDPAHPKLTAQVWCGGVLGKKRSVKGRRFEGGPQMLQLSLDGKRLYVTNSLYSSWDNQFYPDMARAGSCMLQLDCAADGGLTVNENFCVDFGKEPAGPIRAHEIRFPGGDRTSDIWI
jgi:selenium-binding protein 1